ncbi:MAG: glycerol-3-phosphate dehydrogenase/oxidase [Actinomycetaceae bacterium]|nr:glycerol-3-phosphate dehydrogenase/oxidase [Actinomycetaceae bacterium]
MNTALNQRRRRLEIAQLQADPHVDLLVVGGGITGVGIALDAALRGLSVALVEKHDLAFGTSRFSSKLAHGGLRYLAKGEVDIAYHSAYERRLIMERTAPHLVRPLAQVTPLIDGLNLEQKALTRLGYLAGDVLRTSARTRHGTLPRAHYVSPARARRLCPQMNTAGLKGAWVNYDGQMIDDARFVVAVARTAAGAGAKILTYCSAEGARGNGATVVDHEGGAQFWVNARAVINATGVWAASLDNTISIRPARGTHLVFSAQLFGNPTGALTVPLPGSLSRYLFILPADKGRCYLGLTDEDQPGPIPDVPATPAADVDFLLKNIAYALKRPVRRQDILGAFTGLRPLIANADNPGEDSTADLSRKHATVFADSGLVSIVGGKFTEYRLMAEQALDATLKFHNLPPGQCRTRDFGLVGSPTHPQTRTVSHKDLFDLPDSLVARFGREAARVVEDATIANPLGKVAGLDLTRAEIQFALTHEGALTVADILERRTRLSLVPTEAAAARAEVTDIFTEVMGE